MQIKLPFVTKAEYDAIVAAHQEACERATKLEKRVAKLETIIVEAVKRTPGVAGDLRRPVNTWRTRSSNFTKRSQTDPSTFPQTEASNVSEK